MLNIDEDIIQGLIKKEISEQVSDKIDKFLNRKETKDMIKNEIKGQLKNNFTTELIARNIIKDEAVKSFVVSNAAKILHDNIVDTLKYKEEYNDDGGYYY